MPSGRHVQIFLGIGETMEEGELVVDVWRKVRTVEVHRDLHITTPSYTYPNFPRQM
jgi:hypothetical protein